MKASKFNKLFNMIMESYNPNYYDKHEAYNETSINPEINIDFTNVNTAWKALDDYSEQFGTCHENLPIEKQYFAKFLQYFPNEKDGLIGLYEDLKYDRWESLTPLEKKDPAEIEHQQDMNEMINFFKTFK